MVQAIDHIELIVRDVDAHIALFEKLGFEVLTRTAHHGGSAELRLPGENQPIFASWFLTVAAQLLQQRT